MESKFAYVSILSTDNYLVGLLTMYFSLILTKPKYNFFCLVTPNIKKETIKILNHLGITTKKVKPISNPYNNDKNNRKFYNYSKLNMFSLTKYKKLVYLDADMIIMHNIDELFDKPHLSAVNSGGQLPDKKSWDKLNSGLMVIEPSKSLFNDMIKKVGKIEKEKGKGDQSFLHQYYENWPNEKKLHLDHVYNIFHSHLDEYAKHFNFHLNEEIKYNNDRFDPTLVKVVHFIGESKPWYKIKQLKNNKDLSSLEKTANNIWLKKYKLFKRYTIKILNETVDTLPQESQKLEKSSEEKHNEEKSSEAKLDSNNNLSKEEESNEESQENLAI